MVQRHGALLQPARAPQCVVRADIEEGGVQEHRVLDARARVALRGGQRRGVDAGREAANAEGGLLPHDAER